MANGIFYVMYIQLLIQNNLICIEIKAPFTFVVT